MNVNSRASAASRLVLFVVAAAIRLLLSAMFYGSVDITNDILGAGVVFNGLTQYLRVPYFPGIHLFLWIGGLLTLHSRLPVALSFKLFPCLFDAGIALLLMDFGRSVRDAQRRAWLYALAPIPLIITCIHGQWDSIVLFFLLLAVWACRLETFRGDVAAGVAYVLSIIAKPVAVPLLFFFFPKERKRALIIAVSMLVTAVIYLLIINLAGAPLSMYRLKWIFNYANEGVQLIGLPELIPIPRPRVLALIALAPLLWLLWTGRISRERAVLLFFLLIIGCCGISPQYLLWVVPFAFAAGEMRFSAVYNLLGAVALFCYYQSPGTTGTNIENFGTLAPLVRLSWLSPSPAHVELKTACMVLLANLVIPLLCLGAFVTGLIRAFRGPAAMERNVRPALKPAAIVTIFLIAVIFAGTVWAWTMPPVNGTDFLHFALRKALDEYALLLYSGPGLVHKKEPALLARSLLRPGPISPWNIFVLGLTASALWTAAALATSTVKVTDA